MFAFGGPSSEDDDADAGYWLARSALSHAALEQAIKFVAPRLGIVLTDKVLAQAVPIAGAVAGAGLNYIFIDYYQQMARVHFAIRRVERRSSDAGRVRACFSATVRAVKERRALTRRSA